jgi:hypothetical protein
MGCTSKVDPDQDTRTERRSPEEVFEEARKSLADVIARGVFPVHLRHLTLFEQCPADEWLASPIGQELGDGGVYGRRYTYALAYRRRNGSLAGRLLAEAKVDFFAKPDLNGVFGKSFADATKHEKDFFVLQSPFVVAKMQCRARRLGDVLPLVAAGKGVGVASKMAKKRRLYWQVDEWTPQLLEEALVHHPNVFQPLYETGENLADGLAHSPPREILARWARRSVHWAKSLQKALLLDNGRLAWSLFGDNGVEYSRVAPYLSEFLCRKLVAYDTKTAVLDDGVVVVERDGRLYAGETLIFDGTVHVHRFDPRYGTYHGVVIRPGKTRLNFIVRVEDLDDYWLDSLFARRGLGRVPIARGWRKKLIDAALRLRPWRCRVPRTPRPARPPAADPRPPRETSDPSSTATSARRTSSRNKRS